MERQVVQDGGTRNRKRNSLILTYVIKRNHFANFLLFILLCTCYRILANKRFLFLVMHSRDPLRSFFRSLRFDGTTFSCVAVCLGASIYNTICQINFHFQLPNLLLEKRPEKILSLFSVQGSMRL